MKKFHTTLIFLLLIACFMAACASVASGAADTGEEASRSWEEPWEKADLLLFSTHADDDHLFFAGVLPYCVANGIRAQVVYMNNHDDNPVRNTELLDGLWAVGIRNLPVIAGFPDMYSESLSEALRGYARLGFTEDDFIAFCVSAIRRFKPLVVVGHDINGEYGHGGHMLSAAALMKAVELSGDDAYHEESAAEYGLWDAPKTYLNQWKEREIVLAIDDPLPFFDDKTAFQVSQYGFSFHRSQHWTWFNRWLNGESGAPRTASTQIRSYPPGRFGLYRTLAGEDSEEATDFFENVILTKDVPEIAPAPEIPEPEEILEILEVLETPEAQDKPDTRPDSAGAEDDLQDEPGPEGVEYVQNERDLSPLAVAVAAAILLFLLIKFKSKGR